MMKGKRVVILFLLALTLGACVVPPSDPDLYSSAQANRAAAEEALRLAQLQEAALTATAEAPIVRITETAAALMVQNTQAAATSISGITTQTASYVQTSVWWTPTPNATSTAAFALLNAQGTQLANDAKRDDLELARQQDMNDFKGKLPGYSFVVTILVLAILLVFLARREQYRPAPVDARGNVLPLLNVVEGTYTDIDSAPNFRGNINESMLNEWLRRKLALPLMLPEVTAKRQDGVKERDQMIDLATRGLPSGESSSDGRERKKIASQQVMKQLSDGNMASRFQILDSDPGANDQVIQVLDGDWKEAKVK